MRLFKAEYVMNSVTELKFAALTRALILAYSTGVSLMVMAILFLSAGFTLGRPPLFFNSLFVIDLFFATDGSAARGRGFAMRET